jgi:hypothetical protein
MSLHSIVLCSDCLMFSWHKLKRDFIYDHKISAILPVPIFTKDICTQQYCMLIYIYIGFKTFFYVAQHLDSIDLYLPTGLHLGFFRSRPSLYLPSSFTSVFLVLSFVSASTSMLFWVTFLLPFSEHGRTV